VIWLALAGSTQAGVLIGTVIEIKKGCLIIKPPKDDAIRLVLSQELRNGGPNKRMGSFVTRLSELAPGAAVEVSYIKRKATLVCDGLCLVPPGIPLDKWQIILPRNGIGSRKPASANSNRQLLERALSSAVRANLQRDERIKQLEQEVARLKAEVREIQASLRRMRRP
jgi:hypothetical protein